MGERIYYLDNAAATPCDTKVIQAMQPFWNEIFYNPLASYEGGRQARLHLEQARSRVASILGAKSSEIIFTAGATESINLAINGVLASGGKAVIGGTEHTAVRAAVSRFPHSEAPVDKSGVVDTKALVRLIDDETKLISLSYADSEFGTVQPLVEIARLLQKIKDERQKKGLKTPLYFHTDASQAASLLDLKVSRLGVDMMTLNAAKCYGPKQSGALFVESRIVLEPLILGGGQERGLRSGTENVGSAVGLATALELVQASRHQEAERLGQIKKQLMEKLSARLPDIVFDGHPKKSLASHIHFHIDGLDAERVVFHLDDKNIFVATGAACAANRSTRLPSLTAIGLSDSSADGSLRISLGHSIELDTVDFLVDRIAEAIEVERQL